MAMNSNPWCPHHACDEYKAPEQLCLVCYEVYSARKRDVRQEREHCAEIAKTHELAHLSTSGMCCGKGIAREILGNV